MSRPCRVESVPTPGSGSIPFTSRLMLTAPSALTRPPLSILKLSPALRVIFPAVDCTVTPGTIVKSSPTTAESLAIKVTSVLPRTSLLMIRLSLMRLMPPAVAPNPTNPSTVAIVKAPVLLIPISPEREARPATLTTLVSIGLRSVPTPVTLSSFKEVPVTSTPVPPVIAPVRAVRLMSFIPALSPVTAIVPPTIATGSVKVVELRVTAPVPDVASPIVIKLNPSVNAATSVLNTSNTVVPVSPVPPTIMLKPGIVGRSVKLALPETVDETRGKVISSAARVTLLLPAARLLLTASPPLIALKVNELVPLRGVSTVGALRMRTSVKKVLKLRMLTLPPRLS